MLVITCLENDFFIGVFNRNKISGFISNNIFGQFVIQNSDIYFLNQPAIKQGVCQTKRFLQSP